tara:strand:+ start:2142 stop:2561 length:420 start_codon:yes stop_codon:yes gene_type:complete
MSNKEENKELRVYEVVFNKEKSDGITSINLTNKPLFGQFQQREILKAYAELIQKYHTNNFFDDAIEESLDQFLNIYYIECKICKDTVLNLEVKPTFKEWLNINFIKYDNEYYQDIGRNGIWRKNQLQEMYELIDNNIYK